MDNNSQALVHKQSIEAVLFIFIAFLYSREAKLNMQVTCLVITPN